MDSSASIDGVSDSIITAPIITVPANDVESLSTPSVTEF